MRTALKTVDVQITVPCSESNPIGQAVAESWKIIAPFWPLQNLVAANPLRGLEHLPIEEALAEGAAWFEQRSMPKPMLAINRESIKWLQAFFDDGQATIRMPLRALGLYAAWRRLAQHDVNLHENDPDRRAWLAALPSDPEQAIAVCLDRLNIPGEDRTRFLTLLLVTLAGWAAHVKYRTEWTPGDAAHANPVSQADYLALRIAVACLVWPEAKSLLAWHDKARACAASQPSKLSEMAVAETRYRQPLLKTLASQSLPTRHTPAAQLVFCIDVRSEPFRRNLEATGDYETFGFAGFFGVPAQIEDVVTGESYASCPVLLKPRHVVKQVPACSEEACRRDHSGHAWLTGFKRLYQSVKYTFTTPFMLVETLGIANGAWMGLRSFAPVFADSLKARLTKAIRPNVPLAPVLDEISFRERCSYAENALRTMGLTSHFSPLVVLCGHGSRTQNNAYATMLDCGACGGRNGAGNASILATILNDPNVRKALSLERIAIPEETRFIAAEHNTTTDAVTLLGDSGDSGLATLKADLERARQSNNQWRCMEMGIVAGSADCIAETTQRSVDWAQVRPEWGLARNAAFIVAPRGLTRGVDLDGRCFLHSYDYAQDPKGASLEVILTAPMVVAQWINSQYLFSTLDNVAYGGGSKITKNITGKIGVMQGNASDLMTGLPLQSVFVDDERPYHEPQRLMTLVYAPRAMLDSIIAKHEILQTLFGNGWVTLACQEPEDGATYYLNRNLTWSKAL